MKLIILAIVLTKRKRKLKEREQQWALNRQQMNQDMTQVNAVQEYGATHFTSQPPPPPPPPPYQENGKHMYTYSFDRGVILFLSEFYYDIISSD